MVLGVEGGLGSVGGSLIGLGLLLIIIGVFIVFIGVVASVLSSGGEEGKTEYGGVIIIGPIPIVFGSNSRMALAAAVLGVILLILSILAYYLLGRPPH